MHQIDGIIYINLEERTDRRELIEKELDQLKIPEEKIYRLSATLDRLNGIKGCLSSHISALELAESKGWKNVLILEDDVRFMTDIEEMNDALNHFFSHANDGWDVLFLGGIYLDTIESPWEGLMQIHQSLCAHAYLVQRSYLQKLKAFFGCALEMIKNDLFKTQSTKYALDRVWVPLQKEGRWYAFEKQYALQRILPGNIDIEDAPLNRFDEIICIDTGKKEQLREECVRFGVSIEDLHWTSSQMEAIQLAKKLNKKRYLILEDGTRFPQDGSQFDLYVLHFLRWRGRQWDLFFIEGEQCEMESSEHFFFQKVTKVISPKYYAANHVILDTLLEHFSRGEQLNTLEIKPEMAAFCPLN